MPFNSAKTSKAVKSSDPVGRPATIKVEAKRSDILNSIRDCLEGLSEQALINGNPYRQGILDTITAMIGYLEEDCKEEFIPDVDENPKTAIFIENFVSLELKDKYRP